MSNIRFPFWQEVRKLLVDRQDGTYAERVEAYPPAKLMTDGDGDFARVRVDSGQTGFFAGREARTFYEFSIPSGQSQVIKVVSLTDTIVQTFSLELDLASLRLELVVGGTEGGTFATPLPIFKTNTMSTASDYVPQVTMNRGGTHTGGTVVDLLTAISGANANKAVSQTATEALPQGFAEGTFYIRLINTDGATATGIFRARWEERP
jgi:hypothetical protein